MALLRSSTAILTAATLILLVFVITVTPAVGLGGGGRGIPGGKTEIKDVKTNKEVQELGRYSVEEYKRMQGKQQHGDGKRGMVDLTFSEVVEGQKQVVAGIKYYLKINASQKGVPKMFDSVVVVKPWAHSKQLLDFSPSTN